MQKLLNVLFWSVISAAFIGPGTVTTAAMAGASHGYSLLWALTFSTIACLALQEASARITIAAGKNLGQALRESFHGGVRGLLVIILVCGAILLGCAAYEAGNILGGVAGASLALGWSATTLTLVSGILAGLLLWFGTTDLVAKILGVVVALMGMAFFATALMLRPALPSLAIAMLMPSFPQGSGLLIMGLIGTTVVPYNLFLGSSIAKSVTDLRGMRFGLTVAIVLGGLISMAVLVVGTAIAGTFSFSELARALSDHLGDWAEHLFAFGLFAAGFSSAITAPLAAALTARSLFASGECGHWQEKGRAYRSVWLIVLATGIGFGLSGVRPIPIILLAQAFNGILLPLVAVFLFLVVNDPGLVGRMSLNSRLSNLLMAAVVFVCILLGLVNVVKAASFALDRPPPGDAALLLLAALLAIAVAIPIARRLRAMRCQISRSGTPPA